MKLFNITKLIILILSIFIFSTNNSYSQGPNAPEAASFEPVDATDMVDLLTGDMSYVLPLMFVPSPEGGYPIVLSYHAGIAYDQEASWVGLGWNINPGAINRYVNGSPDDWKGAVIRTGERFEEKFHNVSLGVGVGNYDVAIGVSWDSNKTWSGSVSVGLGDEASAYSARVGIGYSSEDGIYGTIGISYGTAMGVGVGIQADTRGFVSVGAGYNFKGADKILPGIGISFSTRGDGNSSLQAILGESRLSSSSSARSNIDSFGVGVRFYLFGAYIRLGYSETVVEKRNLEVDKVWGPLYYNAIENPNPINQLYGNGIANEHNRDYFMDSYQQRIPQYIKDFIGFDNKFEKQKGNIVLPAYDNYTVNAQGLSGVIKPFLLESGIIIGEGYDVEYDEIDDGEGHVSACVGEGAETIFAGLNGLGTKYISRKIIVNNHFNPQTRLRKTFGIDGNINFYFENKFAEDASVVSQTLRANNNSSNLNQYLGENYSSDTDRKYSSDFVETFTNEEIEVLKSQGAFLEAKDYNRTQDEGFVSSGIGGYRVTSSDGKTYHFSRPVYHFEQVNRQLYPKEDNSYYSEYEFYKETRKEKPYATHWLLTAITGPDYIKNSSLDYPSEVDYGFWVRFDYGTWTDGYTWRFPRNGYQEAKITENLTSQEYSWGRKQLVYLNNISTRTHTALFIKSLRDDNKGSAIGGPYPSYENDNSVFYPESKSLKLDEIILLKNEDYNQSGISSNTQLVSIENQGSHTANWTSWYPITYNINQQDRILDSGDVQINSNTGNYDVYNKAIKVIKFNQNYDLAKKQNESVGRLTLNSVEILGLKGESIMPPYVFDYVGKDMNYYPCFALNGCVKDDWGYHAETPDIWSLSSVTSPTGGELQINYEEDEYYTEALSRRYWSDGLRFDINSVDALNFDVVITKDPLGSGEWFDFKDYFDENEDVFFDFWLCTVDEDYNFGCNVQRNRVNINGSVPKRPFHVSSNQIIFRLNKFSHFEALQNSEDIYDPLFTMNQGFGDPLGGDRNTCPDPSNCHDGFNLKFKLLANRTPGSGTGGGIRVSEIKLVDESLNEYTSKYDYTDPVKNRISGITSYAPIKGEKYVAYQSQMPSPRVMYEYVTLTETGTNNKGLESKQFKFDVLEPVYNIFDPNLQAGDHFKATVTKAALDAYRLTDGVDVKLEDNTSMIGALLETNLFNSEGHLMTSSKNNYYSLDQLRNSSYEKAGIVKESFHNMKSVYNYDKRTLRGTATTGIYSWSEECFIDDQFSLKGRHLNITTKINYPNHLVSTERIEGNRKFLTKNSRLDPKTGAFLTTKTQLADNTWIKSDIVPAYTKYSQMGSKVDNINNKHMLTQETMNITSWSSYGNTYGWETLNAGLTTWKDSWSYRDHTGNETIENGIWREHKTFVWKDAVDPEKGTYQTTVDSDNNYFDWNNNEPTSSKWKNISETTRYTHWSKPLEVKNINDNYASSKMAELDSKTLASGNARFTEMFYSGAEYDIDGVYLDQEIKGSQFRDSTTAHTGNYSLKLEAHSPYQGSVFETRMKANEHTPGTYKISVWVKTIVYLRNARTLSVNDGLEIDINNQSEPFNGEVVQAGDWTQLNHYKYLDDDEFVISIKHASNFYHHEFYLDDFRIHPVQASMTSYVYDEETDELTYILGPNNMATKYVYDKAGRLCRTYKEIETNLPETSGGFKITNQYKYHYKNQETLDNCYCCEDGEEIIVYPPLHIKSLKQDNKGEYVRVFQADAQGGSGNYTYQWRWLTDYETNTYSNFVDSIDKFDIPFAAEMCDYKTGTYNKMWKVEVKVTDSQTGESVTKTETVKIGDCKFVFNDIKWADIEISTNYNPCNSLTNYTLRPFIIKPEHNNYSYLSRTYNHITEEWSNYININNDKNNFCGDIFFAPSGECKYSYSLYQTIQYRIIDNITGDVYNSYVHDIYLDCIENPVGNLVVPNTPDHIKYNKFGNVVKKNENGEIIGVYNINDKQ